MCGMCKIKAEPAFNERPMVLSAVGLVTGIILARYTEGTHAVYAVCLLLVMCAASIPIRKRSLTLFLAAATLGFIRLLPYTFPCEGVISKSSVYALANAGVFVPDFILRFSKALYLRCDFLFQEASPLIRAMLLGDRSQLDYFSSSAFRAAGVAHILALSGLHAGILAGALACVIPRRSPGLRFAAVALFLVLYCAVAAFPSSLVRASIMTLCMLAAPLFGRKNDSISSLSFALCFLVLAEPFRLFAAGFQLSFSAAAGIIMLYEPISGRLKKLPLPVAEAFAVTISATLGTLPFTLLIFGRLPLYSPITNIIIVPLVTLILPFALASLLFSFVWYPFGAFLSFPARALAGTADYLSKAFASLPYSLLRFETPSVLACVLFSSALIFLSKFCLLPDKKRYLISSSLLASSVLALIFL